MKCHGFPGPGAEVQIIANPMGDYFGPEDEDRVLPVFNDFLDKYPKDYMNNVDNSEFERRKSHFKQNLR